MKQEGKLLYGLVIAVAGLLVLVQGAGAGTFSVRNGDLIMGFRNTVSPRDDVVINLGPATNFVAQPAGTTKMVGGYAPSQLVPASFKDYNNLAWSAFGMFLNNATPGYPNRSTFITSPRTFDTPSSAPARPAEEVLNVLASYISGIINGARAISSSIAPADPVKNTGAFLAEPVATSLGQNLGAFIGGTSDRTTGTFRDCWANAENGTGGTFTSPIRNDLWCVIPDGLPDPNQGAANSGHAYYVGYFQLETNGVVTFTRAPVTPAPKPAAPASAPSA